MEQPKYRNEDKRRRGTRMRRLVLRSKSSPAGEAVAGNEEIQRKSRKMNRGNTGGRMIGNEERQRKNRKRNRGDAVTRSQTIDPVNPDRS